jgi:hypothetical protein
MVRGGRLIYLLGGVLAAVGPLAAGPVRAEPLGIEQVPPALRPWVDWVLRGHERARCPELPEDEQRQCLWAGALELALHSRGGRFSQTWELLVESAVPLPGDRDHWPVGVLADSRPALVIEREEAPHVLLPPGRHTLSGSFSWKRMPPSLDVPESTGLVSLTLGQRTVEYPRLVEGKLYLDGDQGPEAAADRLEITVHRMVVDDVPLRVITRLQLAVAGKMREVLLGQALPSGFVAHSLQSDLPARVEAGGRIRVQLRPGTFALELAARQLSRAGALTRPPVDGPWAEGDEVWVFQEMPDLRVVTVSGVPPVDPQQTTLPQAWRALPAYLMSAGATMKLEERQRGDADPVPDQLSLNRQLWLDFDGGGYTAHDEIRGKLGRSWRLEMGPETQLGRVAVGGVEQFITRLPESRSTGVEVRQSQVAIEADSRISGARARIPAVGWAHDFQGVNATLNLPPGWRLMFASGADQVRTTWLKRWTLLDLFLVLLVAVAVHRLFGRGPGLIAIAMLVLIMQEQDAPGWIWLAVLVGEALVRALPAGRLRQVVKLYRLGAVLVLLVVACPFVVAQVRAAIHPALGPRSHAGMPLDRGGLYQFADQALEEVPLATPGTPAEELRRQGILNVLSGAEGKGSISDVLGKDRSGVGGLGLAGSAGKPASAPARSSSRMTAYDPNAQVQTGPGVPRWRWTQVQLTWNGPVDQNARLTFWLAPPWMVSLFTLIGVALLVFLALILLRSALNNPGVGFARWLPGLPLLLLATLIGPAPGRAAEFPPKELLEELRTRLLEDPICDPACTSLSRLTVEATAQRLRLRLEASAATPAPLALPGLADHWRPAAITVDGKPATALLRHGGRLWLLLPVGSHQVVLEGPVSGRETVQIPFGPLRPHAVAASLAGWTLAGVGEDGEVGESLELTRVAAASAAGDNSFQSQSLPPFVRVERTLQLGLDWEIETRVVRTTPPGTAVVLEIPLLANESVVSAGVRVKEGRVQLNMAPDEQETRWRTVLAQKSPIALAAPAAGPWSEWWHLDLGPIWHAQISGTPPVRPEQARRLRLRSWRPWPGETVSVAVTRPAGVGGRTFTIDRTERVVTPGARSAQVTLTLQVRSSRGGEQIVTLPAGATLESLQIDGREGPLRVDGSRVTLPLVPGSRTFRLVLRTQPGLRLFYRTPTIDLGVPSVNDNLQVDLTADRWVVLVGGPRLGPAVLAWSALLVILLAGLLLGRSSLTPLRGRHWVLLGLGFVPLSMGAAAVVAGYFLALGWRRDRVRIERAWLHNLVLIGLAAWTVAAVVVLFMAVKQGLLASPDMGIAGNDSHDGQLRWYSDHAAGWLSTGWVVSLPLIAYHLVMLAWAFWLASAMIRWSRWVWSCFSETGRWRPMRRPRPAPSPEPPPTP